MSHTGAESRASHVVIVGGAAGSKIAYDIFARQGRTITGFMDNYVAPGGWGPIEPALLGSSGEPANQELLRRPDIGYFVASGDNVERAKVTRRLYEITGRKPENAIHPAAVISPLARIGAGNLINACAVINACARIGDGTIINTAAVIEHDNEIGDYAQISPRVALAGYVTVEPFAFVGTGATVIPHVRIRRHAIVAAGAVVIREAPEATMVAGVPAVVKRVLTDSNHP
jgi:acetyltransferase EpsM